MLVRFSKFSWLLLRFSKLRGELELDTLKEPPWLVRILLRLFFMNRELTL